MVKVWIQVFCEFAKTLNFSVPDGCTGRRSVCLPGSFVSVRLSLTGPWCWELTLRDRWTHPLYTVALNVDLPLDPPRLTFLTPNTPRMPSRYNTRCDVKAHETRGSEENIRAPDAGLSWKSASRDDLGSRDADFARLVTAKVGKDLLKVCVASSRNDMSSSPVHWQGREVL